MLQIMESLIKTLLGALTLILLLQKYFYCKSIWFLLKIKRAKKLTNAETSFVARADEHAQGMAKVI